MNERQFRSFMEAARTLGGDYAAGYQRGLRRYHHGAGFGTLAEHRVWSALGQDGDPRTDMGDGYRDGVAGKPPRGTHHNVGNRHGAKDNPADRNLNIRCLPGELAHWTKAAQMQHGRTRSDWIRDTLNRAATDEVGGMIYKVEFADVCRKCGGEMKPSKAIAQTFTGLPDFPGKEIVTISPGGPGRLIDCIKCEKCGHSVTNCCAWR